MNKDEPGWLQGCVFEDSVLLRQRLHNPPPPKKNILLKEQTSFTLCLQEKPELTL